MDKIQLRFFEFASEVFQSTAPLVEQPNLIDAVKQLIMASSRMGAGFYRKNFWDFTEEEFQEIMSVARMDMFDTLRYLHILIKDCPNNQALQLLEMKAQGFMVFLGSVIDNRVAV